MWPECARKKHKPLSIKEHPSAKRGDRQPGRKEKTTRTVFVLTIDRQQSRFDCMGDSTRNVAGIEFASCVAPFGACHRTNISRTSWLALRRSSSQSAGAGASSKQDANRICIRRSVGVPACVVLVFHPIQPLIMDATTVSARPGHFGIPRTSDGDCDGRSQYTASIGLCMSFSKATVAHGPIFIRLARSTERN